jgi:hypothetical protein
MIPSLILLYITVFLSFQWGQRIATTPIDTKVFFIITLTIWILLKNIM